MKASAICPRCAKEIETNDSYMIEKGESFHNCKGKMELVHVNWEKPMPETMHEEEILEEEERDLKLVKKKRKKRIK